jgi:hypothetical protein
MLGFGMLFHSLLGKLYNQLASCCCWYPPFRCVVFLVVTTVVHVQMLGCKAISLHLLMLSWRQSPYPH